MAKPSKYRHIEKDVVTGNSYTCIRKTPKNKRKHLSVLEGTAAAGFVDEFLQHGAVHQPEGLCLRHLRQVVDAEAEAKPLQVLGTGTIRGSRSARREGGKERKKDATSERTHINPPPTHNPTLPTFSF